MKPCRLFFPLLLALPAVAAETRPIPPTPVAKTNDPAERDFNRLRETLKAYDRPANPKDTPSERMRDDEARLGQVQQLLLNFIESHPDSPRRWDIVVILRRSMRRFVKDILPGYDANPISDHLVFDQPAKEARIRHIGELERAMLDAPDVPPNLTMAKYRPLFLARKVDDQMTFARRKPAAEIDWVALESQIDTYGREFPDQHEAVWLEETYLSLLEAKRPDATLARLQHSIQSANREVRQLAEGRLRIETARREPLELKFTAIDGREVDLAKLRGKVVLIDFWAMWCGPCIAELPNVKAVYEQYHDRGFEIVGISLDEKADQEKLRQFVQQEDLPWPQYYDGKKWKTALAKKFSISSIPTMLLIAPDGRLATTSARGPALETEVKRLLGL
jgi:thiol-disulfide isomerase/thioredoxin